MNKKLNCVMLIDDDVDDNFFHEMALREADITENIKVAESGFEALDFLSKEPTTPDLIFLDINMPKMNGWEFLNEYSKLETEKKAKMVIIMLTTSLNPADEAKAKKMSDIITFKTKPLTTEMVEDVLKTYFK